LRVTPNFPRTRKGFLTGLLRIMAAGQFTTPTILLLKEGADTSQGVGQIVHNIGACQAVGDILATTLGPRGMDKLIYKGEGQTQVTISNDGATIIKLLDIVHPAARILVDIARAQDDEVGDGKHFSFLFDIIIF
jgi:T-complex protein 1 subunit eta